MELELYHYVIIIIGSFLAGCINTLAGSGSAITLSLLTEILGLPGNLANGSNRVGVLGQGAISSLSFHKNKKLSFDQGRYIIILTTIGAILGVIVATQVSNEQFKFVFKYMMIIMLFVILIRPKRWLRKTEINFKPSWWISIPVFLGVGFYGGFIQMGMGIFFLAACILVGKISIIESNAIKAFTVFVYTIVVIIIFQVNGMVDWYAGGLVAIGQMFGGYITAEYASKYPDADKWAYRLLVAVVILIILKLFGIIQI